ncbi:retrovirus-related Pol polyprotein from transposon 297 [Trichonephila clavipes]|nr:retrovirus-related Pol polyprotein from transposon 297 [Trichonephila clavipes]
MPFGLSRAAPNFQKAIAMILKPVQGRLVTVYMDDVIIMSPSFTEHVDHITQVFILLRDASFALNKDKFHFARDKLKYLGLITSKDGIKTDDNKVKAITEMKPPKNNKEVSKFLGMAETPVLQLPNSQEQFYLFTNASGDGIGDVLNQNQRPFAFASRYLNKAERNYTVRERECLEVIWVLNKFRTNFGVLPVKVITDHAALTKLTYGKNESSRMIRWALFKLSECNTEWEHQTGAQNVVADILSRNPVNNVEGSQISCAALRAFELQGTTISRTTGRS